jgi:hypothetical protein
MGLALTVKERAGLVDESVAVRKRGRASERARAGPSSSRQAGPRQLCSHGASKVPGVDLREDLGPGRPRDGSLRIRDLFLHTPRSVASSVGGMRSPNRSARSVKNAVLRRPGGTVGPASLCPPLPPSSNVHDLIRCHQMTTDEYLHCWDDRQAGTIVVATRPDRPPPARSKRAASRRRVIRAAESPRPDRSRRRSFRRDAMS